ncbi:hypothetical protein J2Z66_005278 [Paenibacillus eucommiae]|uniref:Lycopene cyclase domain-containing protein n=1 Tax=Paenibacillus eucommiae TaxID=1355755 RepID=A0ABS4J1E3_9BACL|nr:hypothetical protein [Paenibacillus eucommiae]
MFGLMNFLLYLASVLFIIFLVFGLIQCRKHHFTEGFYFFLIIFILKVYGVLAPYVLNRYMDSHWNNNHKLPMGMTLGEMVAMTAYIPLIIEVFAYSLLSIGLYRRWNARSSKL